jgi:membrane-associated protease RseP (regulator of RpoE activity)
MLAMLGIVGVIIILVICHEAGHFAVAKLLHIDVPEFSIGFGPKLASWRHQETEYCWRVILAGGYVRMDDADAPPWKIALVALAGPITNAVLALALFTMCFVVVFAKDVHTLRQALLIGPIGVIGGLHVVGVIISMLPQMRAADLSGPIGLVAAAPTLITSWLALILVAGVVSLSLAVVNLLPIPMLDGGQLYVHFLPARMKNVAMWASFVFIVGAGVAIAAFDVVRIVMHTLPM